MINIIVISGFGLNCEEETAFAFSIADQTANIDIIHINEVVHNPSLLKKYQIMAIPGGFSYGDHTGAGNAFAWYLKNNLMDAMQQFRMQDKLIIGICNGCQILVKMFKDDFLAQLLHNESHRYQCNWVDLSVENTNSIWCSGIKEIRLPIAHAEGKFKMNGYVNIALKYRSNPNGSELNAAALSSLDGRVLAMMPHPERAVLFTQSDNWTLLRENHLRERTNTPKYSDGLILFKNAIAYFK